MRNNVLEDYLMMCEMYKIDINEKSKSEKLFQLINVYMQTLEESGIHC